MSAMKNPWMKKNPLMSMWLSGANAVAGSARSRIMAESKRQRAAMTRRGMKQVTDFWTAREAQEEAPLTHKEKKA